ncbi:MAG: hypothetical protein B7Z37_15740 [Verrucomicrobia bacterium 12-59-8]|nr:MAG: hypothetical protein B7Z37_15740 [Verrucomicrobia bacterium 12-59-8]
MTITKEIPTDHVRDLDLHQGDNLHVLAEVGSMLLIQIVKAASVPSETPKGRAGEWGLKYAGAAKGTETVEDMRMRHCQEKYGL